MNLVRVCPDMRQSMRWCQRVCDEFAPIIAQYQGECPTCQEVAGLVLALDIVRGVVTDPGQFRLSVVVVPHAGCPGMEQKPVRLVRKTNAEEK